MSNGRWVVLRVVKIARENIKIHATAQEEFCGSHLKSASSAESRHRRVSSEGELRTLESRGPLWTTILGRTVLEREIAGRGDTNRARERRLVERTGMVELNAEQAVYAKESVM